MRLTVTGYVVKVLFILLCCAVQHGLLEAKAIKKSKHAVDKSGSKKNSAPKGEFCVNHSYCSKYSDLDCASEWVQLNCPRMCRLCEYEGPELMKLPAVLYYKKGDKKHGISGSKHKNKHTTKHIEKRDDGDRRDVVFLSHPNDYSPTKQPDPVPTTSYSLFDYQSNYRNWLFLYPDQHPVNLRYVDTGKAADPNQQSTVQQTAAGAQDAPVASAPAGQDGVAAPVVAAPATGGAPLTAPAAGVTPAAASTTASAAAPATVSATDTSAAAPAATAPAPTAAQSAPAAAVPAAGAIPGVAPASAQTPAASNPAVPQVGQAAATVQQPAAPIVAQKPVAAQQPAANETIQVINQTVSLASNTTGFVPSVANASQPNQTIMAGAFTAGNMTSNETVATGNITTLNQSQPWVEPLSQNSTLSQNTSLSENSSLTNNLTRSSAPGQNQTSPLNTTTQNALATSALLKDKASIGESFESLNTSPLSPFHLSEEEVTSQHKLHLVNSDKSSKMQGNFRPNGASVTLSGPGTLDLTSTGQSFTQDVTVDSQQADSENAADYPWTCCKKQPRPEGCKKCPDLPKAPPLTHIFGVYCNDLYKDCAYGYSNCNDTWWQINCPKRCNLCKTEDAQSRTEATQTKEIYPSEVNDLKENATLESDLVAPAPGAKPLVAKYTLRVKPKLLNGVPQTQEIRIMPPNKAGVKGYVKPLMVLKQNITKPMIENIEIDIPPKGAKFSSKPSVEVIEGDHTEMLQVSKGQAIVEDPVQKSQTEPEDSKPEEETNDVTASNQTESSPVTQETANNTIQDQTNTQTQSPLDDQAATLADQTNQAQSTTTAQVTAAVPEAATASKSTQADASTTATIQPDASAPQAAAYTNTQTCTDDGRCAPYTADRCADPWLRENCKSMCKLC